MKLQNKRVAILATDRFEQSELEEPKSIQGMKHADKGDSFDVDIPLDHAKAEEFDALTHPGGLMNPDSLRTRQGSYPDLLAGDSIR